MAYGLSHARGPVSLILALSQAPFAEGLRDLVLFPFRVPKQENVGTTDDIKKVGHYG